MRKFTLYFIALVATLGLSACSPAQAIYMTFGPGGGGDTQLQSQAWDVAGCETGYTWRTDLISPTNDHGLFQINRYYHEAAFKRVTGQPWYKVYDPFWNAVYAKHLHNRLGWQPWTCRYVL